MAYNDDTRYNIDDFVKYMKSENMGITHMNERQVRRLFRQLPEYIARVLNSWWSFDMLWLGRFMRRQKNVSWFVWAWVYLTPKVKFSVHFLRKTRCKK